MNLYLDTFKDKKVGILNIGITDKGLRFVSFGRYSGLAEILDHACNKKLVTAKNVSKTKPVIRQLKEYFQGKRTKFDIKLDLDYLPSFKRKVLKACAKIPYGKLATYGELAKKAGSPRAARAVGQAMATNPIAIVIPCHRVVGSDGGLTGYAAGIDTKKRLLAMEAARLIKTK
jgi:methylated-DNA-[protein]-cysteine S-methyltransferase